MSADHARALAILETLPMHARSRRHARGLSIRRAADEIGVHFTTLDRIERGHTNPSLDVALAILRWLDRTNAQLAPKRPDGSAS